MQLHDVVAATVTTERSAEEVRYQNMKTRDATILALAVFLAVAIATVSSGPVFAQYAPCSPSYPGSGGSCYPSYNNPSYGNPYNTPSYGNPYNNPYYPSYGNHYNSPGYGNYYNNPYYPSYNNHYGNPYNNPYYPNYGNPYYNSPYYPSYGNYYHNNYNPHCNSRNWNSCNHH